MNEAALKERLRTIAEEKKITLDKIWKQLLLERFLARLSDSSYQDRFIFKGGLLLAKYISIRRETIDIDFLMTKIKSDMRNIEKIISEIASINLGDGFHFSWFFCEELNQPQMEYIGFRIKLDAKFGKMRDKIQVDIAVGDVVEPVDVTFNSFKYKGKPIFVGEVSLHVYPPEAIFSEKLETLVSKGVINSRMKDYHDLLLMIREPNFLDRKKLFNAIKITFERRGTKFILPVMFDEEGVQTLQKFWSAHLRGLGVYKAQLNFPDEIGDVMGEINGWLGGV